MPSYVRAAVENLARAQYRLSTGDDIDERVRR